MDAGQTTDCKPGRPLRLETFNWAHPCGSINASRTSTHAKSLQKGGVARKRRPKRKSLQFLCYPSQVQANLTGFPGACLVRFPPSPCRIACIVSWSDSWSSWSCSCGAPRKLAGAAIAREVATTRNELTPTSKKGVFAVLLRSSIGTLWFLATFCGGQCNQVTILR